MPKPEDSQPIESSPKTIPRDAARLGPGLSFKGEVKGAEDLVLQGPFFGTIALTGKNVYIDVKADVTAEIEAADVFVYGSLSGNIVATGRVLLASSARVKGDIAASRISIEDGAQFKGAIQMKK
jgi:cytoskeletal protein CcmA (bactofilin family)